ncbi:hypothetical protein R3P38DRAFT_343682 [Favolaschia claudopus]|uniref:Zn(2)-C6 fungal-type domain-containing protein n=1 Tax=Favolaschia claudopus TaxID=2862362 RepID=A0AAV9ZJU2_9AGAR
MKNWGQIRDLVCGNCDRFEIPGLALGQGDYPVKRHLKAPHFHEAYTCRLHQESSRDRAVPTMFYPDFAASSKFSVQMLGRKAEKQALSPGNSQSKRPTYTRSRTGCLTCRVKKIKCDEAKPNSVACGAHVASVIVRGLRRQPQKNHLW